MAFVVFGLFRCGQDRTLAGALADSASSHRISTQQYPFSFPPPSPSHPASFAHAKKGAHMRKPGRDVLCMRRHIRMRLIVLMDRRLCRIFAPCPRWPSTCGCSWLESPFPATTVLAVISNGLYIFTDSAPEHPQADDIRGNDANDDGGCGESCTQNWRQRIQDVCRPKLSDQVVGLWPSTFWMVPTEKSGTP